MIEFLFGAFLGAVIAFTGITEYQNKDREKCEKLLPRNQVCVKTWVPEPAKEKP